MVNGRTLTSRRGVRPQVLVASSAVLQARYEASGIRSRTEAPSFRNTRTPTAAGHHQTRERPSVPGTATAGAARRPALAVVHTAKAEPRKNPRCPTSPARTDPAPAREAGWAGQAGADTKSGGRGAPDLRVAHLDHRGLDSGKIQEHRWVLARRLDQRPPRSAVSRWVRREPAPTRKDRRQMPQEESHRVSRNRCRSTT